MAEPNQTSMASKMAIARFFKLDPLAIVTRYAGMEITRDNAGRARRVIIVEPGRPGYGVNGCSELFDCPLAYLCHFQAVGGLTHLQCNHSTFLLLLHRRYKMADIIQ